MNGAQDEEENETCKRQERNGAAKVREGGRRTKHEINREGWLLQAFVSYSRTLSNSGTKCAISLDGWTAERPLCCPLRALSRQNLRTGHLVGLVGDSPNDATVESAQS